MIIGLMLLVVVALWGSAIISCFIPGYRIVENRSMKGLWQWEVWEGKSFGKLLYTCQTEDQAKAFLAQYRANPPKDYAA